MQPTMDQPHVQLATLSRAYVLSRAIQVIAQLNVADVMSLEPMKVETIAQLSGTVPELLERILKFLTAYQIFSYNEQGFALTPLSMPLRQNDPHSIKDVVSMVDESWWQAFSQLKTTLETGESSFSCQHHDDFFSYLTKNPEKQAQFDKGMARLSTFDDEAVATAYNFSKHSSLVDMGGGRGGLVNTLAHHYPQLRIILLDTESVIQQIDSKNFSSNVILTAGDFLKDIPKADSYLFKGVLHDFSDELMHQILKNCSNQMPPSANLYIAEQVMPVDNLPHPNKTMDIVMMVLLGGRQRTLKEWQKSIEPAGFIFEDCHPTKSLFTVMRFVRAH